MALDSTLLVLADIKELLASGTTILGRRDFSAAGLDTDGIVSAPIIIIGSLVIDAEHGAVLVVVAASLADNPSM